MKIIYFANPWFLDADFPLIKELIKKNHEVIVFLYINPSVLQSPLLNIDKIYPHSGIFDSSIYGNSIDKYKKYLNIDKIYVINALSGKLKMKNVFKPSKNIINYIDKINPDIIHLINWPSITSLDWVFKYRKKIVCTIHDPYPHEGERGIKSRILNILSSRPVRNYILLNNKQTEYFKRYFLIHNADIYYSRLGNYDLLRCFVEQKQHNGNYILFYGRITPYKGINVLLSAFKQIEHFFPDIKLVIAGRGNFNFDITEYMNDPQIHICNKFIDFNELAVMIQNAKFIVCPYISATQSGVIASALALNKPVVVTNVGALPDMIANEKSGMIVPPNDINALANIIRKMLDNESLLKEMSNYIKEDNIHGYNSWNKITEDIVKVYKDIIN